MEALFKQAWLRYPLAAMALSSCISTATASTLSTESAADAATAALGALPLREALGTSSSALAELPAAQSALLPLPSSFFTLNNPYVMFADVLAMSSSSRQGDSSNGQVFLYDANNNLPVPGPVPLPSPLLLLMCGVGLLLASRGRTGAAAS